MGRRSLQIQSVAGPDFASPASCASGPLTASGRYALETSKSPFKRVLRVQCSDRNYLYGLFLVIFVQFSLTILNTGRQKVASYRFDNVRGVLGETSTLDRFSTRLDLEPRSIKKATISDDRAFHLSASGD